MFPSSYYFLLAGRWRLRLNIFSPFDGLFCFLKSHRFYSFATANIEIYHGIIVTHKHLTDKMIYTLRGMILLSDTAPMIHTSLMHSPL